MTTTRRLTLRNDSTELAPAFGIAEVDDAAPVDYPVEGGTEDADSVLSVRKPTGTGRVVAVGPWSIPYNADPKRYGKGFTGDCFVRFSGSDPSPGDTLYATSGSWELSAAGTGTGVTVAGDVRTIGEGMSAYKVCRVEIGGGSGGGGGVDAQRCRVYDDTVNRVTSVRCLIESFSGGEWVVDTDDDYTEAYPLFDQAVTLADDGCCGGDGTLTAAGASIVTPIMTDNRVTDAEETAVTIEAVDTLYYLPSRRAATCTITVTDGTNSVSDTASFDSADGTASVTLDFTAASPGALTKGVLKVTLEPEDAGSNALPERSVALTYSNGDDSTALAYFTGQAQTPDLVDASDTGASDSDNYTSDTTPTLRTVWNNTSPIGTGGPTPRVYANGVLLVSGTSSSYDTGPGEDVADLTPTTMSEGVYLIQLVYDYNPSGTSYYSPASEPIEITISADADDEVSSTVRYYRQGVIQTIQGVVTLREISNCKMEMSEAEITKADA